MASMSKRSFAIALFPVLALPWSLFAQAPSLTVQVDHPTRRSAQHSMADDRRDHFSYDGGSTPNWSATEPLARTAGARSLDDGGGELRSRHFSRCADRSERSFAAQPEGARDHGDGCCAGRRAKRRLLGFPVQPQTAYSGSFYAKTDSAGFRSPSAW